MKSIDEQKGQDGLTIKDRAELIANTIGVSRARLAGMILRNDTYFGNCTGIMLNAKTSRMLTTIFPRLNITWFRSGEGTFDASDIDVPTDLVNLVESKSSLFRSLFADPNGQLAALQYLVSHGVDPDEFCAKYGSIYPALAHYQQGSADKVLTSSPTSASSQSTSELLAIIADQQRTIARLTELLAQKSN